MKRRQDTPGGVVVQVKGKNMTVTPELHDGVVAKMSRLDKYHDRLRSLEVELVEEPTRAAHDHHRAEVTAHVAGRTVRVTAADGEVQAAVDACVDKLYRQLNRHKERSKEHHGSKLAEMLPAEVQSSDDPADAAAEEGLIQVESLDVRPQFEDEAAAEMERLGHQFYVFLNARNEQINILYRRSDGLLGLIEPRLGAGRA